ncbi:MAG: TetR/AcrR family transcriptional regulator [Burkholderiaceae bacterium]
MSKTRPLDAAEPALARVTTPRSNASGPARKARRGKRVSAWSDVVQSPDQQYELKRKALIHAAARAFNARGYHNTSLDDVAAELGVTRAALYHYIRSKQEILFECHMLTYDLGDQAIEYARAHAKNGLEAGCLLIRRFIELFNGAMGRVAVMSEHQSLEPKMRALIQKRRDDFDHAFRSIIESGIRDGSIRAVDAKLAVFFAMGAVNWMGTRWYRPDGPLSIGQIATSFEDMFRAAMSA